MNRFPVLNAEQGSNGIRTGAESTPKAISGGLEAIGRIGSMSWDIIYGSGFVRGFSFSSSSYGYPGLVSPAEKIKMDGEAGEIFFSGCAF